MMMKQYRVKPVRIKALRYDGLNRQMLINFITMPGCVNVCSFVWWEKGLELRLRKNRILITPNDWVVRTEENVLYVYSDKEFKELYEECVTTAHDFNFTKTESI